MRDSFIFSSVVDLLLAGVMVFAIIYLIGRARDPRLARVRSALKLLTVGVAMWGIYHLLNFATVSLAPSLLGTERGASAIAFAGRELAWVAELATVIVLIIGFLHLVRSFTELIGQMQSTTEELEEALNSRTNMADDLQQEARAQRESIQSKAEFLVGISHELRTPLNGIIGLASLLTNTELDTNQRKLLSTLDQSAQAMLSRINDVLDLARLESGQVALRTVGFRPDDLANTVLARFEPIAAEKGIELQFSTSEAAQIELMGDQALVRQLIRNLVSNAVKFTPRGHVALMIDAEALSGDQVALILTVSDTGIGMPPEQVERLNDLSRYAADGEADIGLSICWRIAKLMEGGLTATSERHKGTEIIARLRVQGEPTAKPLDSEV